MTQTEVDERIGRRRGYLSHVFQRRVDLKVEDLMLALEVLHIEPARFFEAACEAQASGSASLLRLVAEQPAETHHYPRHPPAVAPAITTSDQALLEDRVRKALRSILGQLSSAEERGSAASGI